MSLHSGVQIAIALEPIINPHNLQILGWWCNSSKKQGRLVLLTEDVREMMPNGLAVNGDEAMSSVEDLVRHREILDIKFQLIDKLGKTKRHKLGKVGDYSYNDGMFVQKIYVSRPMTKIFSSEDTLLVDRTQILEVTDSYILVKDTEVKDTAEVARAAVPA